MPVDMAPPIYGNFPAIQPPQSENFLQTAQQAQALQGGALSLEEQRMQLASQRGMMQAWQAAGGDPDKMQQIAPNYGVLPKDMMALQTTLMGMAKTRAETDKDVLAAQDATLSTLAVEPLISVHHGVDEREVAEIFDKYNLLTVPVVDEDGKLSGVITADDIISVLRNR